MAFNRIIKSFLLFSFFFFQYAFAQPADTDIWLYQVLKTEKGIEFKNGFNMTNHQGYDNQPFFTPDNKFLLFTSTREGKQSDIFRYHFKSGKISRVTATAVSEYSPMIKPDGKNISVVMVERDSSQRIWHFNAMIKSDETSCSENEQQLLIPELDSVGYYSWLNKDTIVYYKLTQPHSLHVYALSSKKDVLLGYEPTRSFRPCGFRKFFYVLKKENNNELRVYDWSIRKSEVLALADKANEDFIWDKDYGFMKSEGGKIFTLNATTKDWMEWGNFTPNGINKITRFAVSPDGKWLAVVSNQ